MSNLNSTYLSSVSYLNRRDILDKVLDLYEEEKTVKDMLEFTGRAKPTDQPEYHNFVNDWLYKTATVASATAAASLTTDADDYSVGTIVLTSAADAPIVGEIGMQPLTGSLFLVTAVSGTSVTVKSLNTVTSGDAAYTADWTANDIITFPSNAYGEGTEANQMRRSSISKEMNYIQMFQTKHGVTNLAKGSKVEVTFKGKPYYFLKEQHDAWRKHEMDKMFAYIVGKRGKTFDANGNVVYMTEGLDHYITDRGGINHTVGSAGVINKAEFRSISRKLDRVRGPEEYWLWAGGEADNEMDDLWGTITETTQGGLSYNSFGRGNAKKKAIDLGVTSVYVYGRSFHKKRFSAMDHPKVTWVNDNTGGNASKYPGYTYFVPANQIKVDNGTFGGGMNDRVCVRYMEHEDGTTSRINETHLGALAPGKGKVKSDGRQVFEIEYATMEGLHCTGIQHFARMDMNDAANYLG